MGKSHAARRFPSSASFWIRERRTLTEENSAAT
jgi:hypothetical protein